MIKHRARVRAINVEILKLAAMHAGHNRLTTAAVIERPERVVVVFTGFDVGRVAGFLQFIERGTGDGEAAAKAINETGDPFP